MNDTIYLVTANRGLYAWRAATGSVRFVGDVGVGLTDIAFDPAGRLYGITFDSLWRVDPFTAETRLVGRLTGPLFFGTSSLTGANGFDISPEGVGRISSTNNTLVVTVDLSTGAVANTAGPLLQPRQGSAGDIWFGENGRYWLTTQSSTLVEAAPTFDLQGRPTGREAVADSDFIGNGFVYGLTGIPEGVTPPGDAFLIGFSGRDAYFLGNGRSAVGPGFARLPLDSEVYGAALARPPDPGPDGMIDAQEIALLYEVAFARRPDLPGLNFWLNKVYAQDGFSVVRIAEAFYFIDAFEQALGRDPETLSNAEIVEALYTNVLDRPGLASQNDPAGYAFWLDALNGGLSRPDLMRYFAISAENVANAAYVANLTQGEDGGWIF